MRTRKLVQAGIAALVVASSACWAAISQDDIDEAKRVQQLEEAKKAAAEARKATAEADAAEAKAKLGTLDASNLKPPTGEAKALSVEGSILAYTAVDRVATNIVKAVAPVASAGGGLKDPIVLLSDKEFNALQQMKSYKQGLTLLSSSMSKFKVPKLAADDPQCKEPLEGGAGLGVLGSVNVALQIAQLFKVDKKLEGSDVSIDEFALASVVVAKLMAAQFEKVVYGPVYLAGSFGGSSPFEKSDIAKILANLAEQQSSIDVALAEVSRRREKLKLRENDTKVKLPEACKAPFEEARTIYTAMEVRGKSLKDRADNLLSAAMIVDVKTGATLLQTLVQAEAMNEDLKGARVLRLKPIAGGGTVFTRTSLFSTHVGVGGGAVVAYMLFKGTDGSVMVSGTAAEYGGFVEPQDLGAYLGK